MTEIFTHAALAQRSLPALHILVRQVQDDLAHCEIGSDEHFALAANLQNIRRAIAVRTAPALRR